MTRATCGIPAADILAWLKKMRPKCSRSGKDVGLQRQVCAAAVDEIDARQLVLERDLLGPEMLLHGHREVGPALDGRVVGDDTHRVPSILPRPVTMPAPGASSSYMPRRPPAGSARERPNLGRAAGRCAPGPAACRARDGARSSDRRRPHRALRRHAAATRRSSTRVAIAVWSATTSGLAGSRRLRMTAMASMIGRGPYRVDVRAARAILMT